MPRTDLLSLKDFSAPRLAGPATYIVSGAAAALRQLAAESGLLNTARLLTGIRAFFISGPAVNSRPFEGMMARMTRGKPDRISQEQRWRGYHPVFGVATFAVKNVLLGKIQLAPAESGNLATFIITVDEKDLRGPEWEYIEGA